MKLKIIGIIALLFIESLSGSEYRKGLYAGIGAGYRDQGGLIMPIEIGYGISNNLLISLSRSSSIGFISESLSGLGISYYMNDKFYIQAIAGNSYNELIESISDTGLGFSLGVGIVTSKRSSIEVSYMHLDFDKDDKKIINNVSEPLDMFSLAFMYRLF